MNEDFQIFLGVSQLKGVSLKVLRDLGGVSGVVDKFNKLGAQDFCEQFTRDKFPNAKDQVMAKGENALTVIRDLGINLITDNSSEYPESLRNIGNLRPLWLFYKGDIHLLNQKSIAVVGTRSPSQDGEFLTKYAVSALKEFNITVVSGLAKGVDEIAHEWAVSKGMRNISILGTGLMKMYPARNIGLSQKIIDSGGLLLSEYMPPDGPSAESFVWRNRLQAAISSCVIAPEWKQNSGTAHTIKYAKSFGIKTVNLLLTSCFRSHDSGNSDYEFEVPKNHSLFIDFLEEVLTDESVYSNHTGPQSELFE